jgi:hypothetical protein
MAPSQVNQSALAMMAALARYRDDLSGNLVTGGSSTAFTLTTNQVLTALTDGFAVAARISATNGAAPTLNVDALGPQEAPDQLTHEEPRMAPSSSRGHNDNRHHGHGGADPAARTMPFGHPSPATPAGRRRSSPR